MRRLRHHGCGEETCCDDRHARATLKTPLPAAVPLAQKIASCFSVSPRAKSYVWIEGFLALPLLPRRRLGDLRGESRRAETARVRRGINRSPPSWGQRTNKKIYGGPSSVRLDFVHLENVCPWIVDVPLNFHLCIAVLIYIIVTFQCRAQRRMRKRLQVYLLPNRSPKY